MEKGEEPGKKKGEKMMEGKNEILLRRGEVETDLTGISWKMPTCHETC